ncbi:hypothetical protein C0081_09055 [Cohaesibacter celericrescens]|uniref:Uncharacterized protein n=1 Tax=Cohaesibacter celericrescens TaxID=2067669 RepID=A0A2N5XSF2_9HYPH|nr:hypothetical protein C0081_09055 [Cohaesibacter celericrescens]
MGPIFLVRKIDAIFNKWTQPPDNPMQVGDIYLNPLIHALHLISKRDSPNAAAIDFPREWTTLSFFCCMPATQPLKAAHATALG